MCVLVDQRGNEPLLSNCDVSDECFCMGSDSVPFYGAVCLGFQLVTGGAILGNVHVQYPRETSAFTTLKVIHDVNCPMCFWLFHAFILIFLLSVSLLADTEGRDILISDIRCCKVAERP